MARTIRNSARDPHKRNSVKRDAIGAERRQSKRSNWIGPCDTVTAPCDDYLMDAPTVGEWVGRHGWL